MSTGGLQWEETKPYVNKEVFNWLKKDWKLNLIRGAMYTKYGYLDFPEIKNELIKTVDAAIATDLYVIIDWHTLSDNNPQTYKKEAIAFFNEMSKTYGSFHNVIYELCNEPNGDDVTWAKEVKPYNEELISVIRKNDPDNVIIACVPRWCLDIVTVANDPIKNQPNLMYNVHFYAGGTGREWLQGEIDKALKLNTPIFITEWGTSWYSGNDGLYFDSARNWLQYMKDRKISWANWSLSNKNETSAALNPTASSKGEWREEDISESGKFIREYLRAN
jgi:endoglucanase